MQCDARMRCQDARTDGRTDLRTVFCSLPKKKVTLSNAREPSPKWMNFDRALTALSAVSGFCPHDPDCPMPLDSGRYPIIRTHETTERQRINPDIRLLVLLRDNFCCRWCGANYLLLEMDHIIPWSAGGSDHMDNLRCLCSRCNSERSNRSINGTIGLVLNQMIELNDDAGILPAAMQCTKCCPWISGHEALEAVFCIRCRYGSSGLPQRQWGWIRCDDDFCTSCDLAGRGGSHVVIEQHHA